MLCKKNNKNKNLFIYLFYLSVKCLADSVAQTFHACLTHYSCAPKCFLAMRKQKLFLYSGLSRLFCQDHFFVHISAQK